MDPISDAFHAKDFRIALPHEEGYSLPGLVSPSLPGHAFGSDFEAVRPYGKQGDWKCDGRRPEYRDDFSVLMPLRQRALRTQFRRSTRTLPERSKKMAGLHQGLDIRS